MVQGRWGYENGKHFLRRNTINDTLVVVYKRETRKVT